MADVELVIKIDEKLYKSILNMDAVICRETLVSAVAYGTPLPEVHGRLGDLDELEKRISNYRKHKAHMMDELTVFCEEFIIEGIKDTPTIIGAKVRE